ncbi:hypothetical protein [Actinomadura logoneensis]|uniref:hypothetical protein n=1 Tax=Actinomadura logoneensis TaxID=2293572 RepID=UPI001314010C|nr:hypothetical protein [Actinomadura logoneensis]
MTEYRVVYGPAEKPVTETVDADQIVEEGGVVTFFKDDDAVLRVQKANIHNLPDLPVES